MAVVVVGCTIEDAEQTIRYLGIDAVAVSPRSDRRLWGTPVTGFVFTPNALDEASAGLHRFDAVLNVLRRSAMKSLVVQ